MMVVDWLLSGLAIRLLLLAELSPQLLDFGPQDGVVPADLVERFLKLPNVFDC